MGKVFKNMKLAKQVFANVMKLQKWADEMARKNPTVKAGLPIDPRDLVNVTMVYNYGHNNYKTEEELKKAIEEVSGLLKTDKEKVFNKMYEVYENFNFRDPKVDTFQGCLDSLYVFKLSQGFAWTMDNNPDYAKKYYGTSLKKSMAYDGCSLESLDNTEEWANEFLYEGISLSSTKYLDKDMQDAMIANIENKTEFDAEMDEFSSSVRNELGEALRGRKETPEIELPYAFSHLEKLNAEEDAARSAHKRFKEIGIENFFVKFADMVTPSDTFTGTVTKHVLDQRYGEKNIFIDGKRITDGVKYDSNNIKEYYKALALKLSLAIKEGKAVDVVNSYEINGKLEHKLTPIQFKLSPSLKEEYEKEYDTQHHIGFIHKTFFNWGPWKINYPDMANELNRSRLSESLSEKTARETSILHKMETEVEPEYNKLKIEEKMSLNAEKKKDIKKEPLRQKEEIKLEDEKKEPVILYNPDESMDDILIEDVKEKNDNNTIPLNKEEAVDVIKENDAPVK